MIGWLFQYAIRFSVMWSVLMFMTGFVWYLFNYYFGFPLEFWHAFLGVVVFGLMAGGAMPDFIWEIIGYWLLAH